MELDFAMPEEFRQKYVFRRVQDIESLRAALNNSSFEEFQNVGHQLRGNVASFGFFDLEKIAERLELAGNQRDQTLAREQLGLLEQWFKTESAAIP